MIEAAIMKQLHLELTRIVRGGRSGLDYIKVPDNEWHFDHQINELFCFKEGLFYAHVCIVRADKRFTTKVIIKKLPDSAVIATVDSNADSHQLRQSHGIQTWTNITDKEALESWLLRRNKKHLQQVRDSESPHVSVEMEAILGEHGTEGPTTDLLTGKIARITKNDSKCVTVWRKHIAMTEAERDLLPVFADVDPEIFATIFKEANERTSSSPEGLHYTMWKAVAEREDFCKYMCKMMYLPFKYGFSVLCW